MVRQFRVWARWLLFDQGGLPCVIGTLGGSLYAIRQAYTGDPLVRPAARFGFNVGIGVAMYMAFRNRLGYDDPETDLRKVVFAGHATGAMIGLLNGSIRYAAQG